MPSNVAQRAWQVVLEKIEGDLLAGRLSPGDRLPPERDLSVQLGVGRSSVREAIRVLEVLGLVRTGTGSGPSSGATIVATPRGGLSALLRLQVAANGFAIDDVVSTRVTLESAVVEALAAADAPDLSAVRDAIRAMEQPGLATAEFLALDRAFHVALAEASGNAVVTAIMVGLRTAIDAYVEAGALRVTDWAATTARLTAEHRSIVGAVERGDAERAQRLVRDHIAGYYAEAVTS
ncbi:FadR/GntR family transcriptional regulator [Microbacterium sp. P06]|uniref:FadR/GntR family transcriptional regulator n=1 Tax=Microbacterium sp. P06 TaxID=3366949 RepID=UPI0037463381